MAQAPTAPESNTALQGKILQALREAGTPLKTLQLCRLCQEPKKTLNQTLYRMKAASLVMLVGPATWSLAEGGSGPGGPTGQAASDQGQEARPQRPSDPQPGGRLALPPPEATSPPGNALALPPGPGPLLSASPQLTEGLSDVEERILRLLDQRPLRALLIAQGLGYARTKDVNPVLHGLQARRLLRRDPDSGVWALDWSGDAGGRSQPHVVVIQKQTFNTINHWGPNNHIVVQNPRNIQIGDGTVMANDSATLQFVSSDPSDPSGPRDPSDPRDPRDPRAPCDVSTLENQPEEDAARTGPTPGPVEDASMGHASGTVSPGPAGSRADAGTGDSRRDPRQLRDAASRPEDEPPCTRLGAMTLGSQAPARAQALGSAVMRDTSPQALDSDFTLNTSPRATDAHRSPRATDADVTLDTSTNIPEDGGC
ncbi:Z-DNA-binding protein 1 [Sorex fumeus]|uniref:Z-DNA-binding protein 1 n=1 Tax=Sorex fumeus TaxID=62283 RepID=UPI0024AE5987|nr:Z-DNA-binding protein 1 [Sorex fumeus]